MPYMPYVVEKHANGERSYDVFSRLLKDRIIFLTGEITEVTADVVIAQMLFLESQDPDKDISLYINSPGGSVTDGMAIYDTMQFIKPDVSTICFGMAASMASILLMAGARGKRFALPHAEVMIHQPLGGTVGQASDIEIHAKHILRTRKIRGFDICEISPRFDQDNTTASLGAVLIFTVVNTICKLKNLAVNTGVEYYG